MTESLRINGIIEESIVDGFGLRYVLFTQGCPHNCYKCHNPQTHDYNKGLLVEIDELVEEITQNPLLKGVTFSGGEPFVQAKSLTVLAKELHKRGLDIITYTGYTYENLIHENNPERMELLKESDVLVDGPFIYEKRNASLIYRGSSNQRLLFLDNGIAENLNSGSTIEEVS